MEIKPENQLTYEDYKTIIALLSQAANYGCYRGLDHTPAITIYNKILNILDEYKNPVLEVVASKKTKKRKNTSNV